MTANQKSVNEEKNSGVQSSESQATQELNAAHTPLPWEVSSDTLVRRDRVEVTVTIEDRIVVIADCGRWDNNLAHANAQLIVDAVNSHAALVAALGRLTCAGCENRIGWNEWPTNYGDWKQCLSCREARAALALANGQET